MRRLIAAILLLLLMSGCAHIQTKRDGIAEAIAEYETCTWADDLD